MVPKDSWHTRFFVARSRTVSGRLLCIAQSDAVGHCKADGSGLIALDQLRPMFRSLQHFLEELALDEAKG
jgi:hypothetical protein